MAYAITHAGDAATLQALVNLGLTLRLFVNDRLPCETDQPKDYVEASFPGYKHIRLAGSAWTVVEGDGLRTPTHAVAAEQSFRRTSAGAPANVYGWYLTLPSGKVYCAERFDRGVYELEAARETLVVEAVIEIPWRRE